MKYIICILFKQITTSPVIHCLIEEFLAFIHRQDQYFNIWVKVLDKLSCFKPSQSRHIHIDYDHIWSRFFKDFQKFKAISRFVHHLQFGIFLDEPFKTLAHQNMIIYEYNAIITHWLVLSKSRLKSMVNASIM